MSTIKIGTTFRAGYADSNAEWRVTRKLGRGVWEAVITEDNPDYSGVSQSFRTQDIDRSLRLAAFFEQSALERQARMTALNLGDLIVHTVRSGGSDGAAICKIVDKEDDTVLIVEVLDLVGFEPGAQVFWYESDGSIWADSRFAKALMTGEPMTTSGPRPGIDREAWIAMPSALPNLTVPAVTGEAARQMLRKQTAASIRTLLDHPTAENMAKIATMAKLAETETPKEYPAWTPQARGERAGATAASAPKASKAATAPASTVRFTKGQSVSVQWTDGYTYSATVTKAGKASCTVKFEDGSTASVKHAKIAC